MKKQIIILGLCFVNIVASFSQEDCDTLKWKVVKTQYCENASNTSACFGNLNEATINIDTLSVFYPRISFVNVSDDIFSIDESYIVFARIGVFADTGVIQWMHNYSNAYSFKKECNPHDTISTTVSISCDLEFFLDHIINNNGVDFEQISYWKMIIGIRSTSRDGNYSNRVYYEGADTSIFYITKTSVNTQKIDNNRTDISIFPNPAQSQFMITNTEDARVSLYNILGQRVKYVAATEENTVVHTENLPAGIYVVKVEKGNGVVTKKVQITR